MNAKPQTTDILQANKDYFDSIANTGGYDESPFVEQVSRQIANAIKDEYDFDENRTVMLDYACGTGQMSRLLAPYTHEIIGVDISQGMVDYYNQRVHNQGIPPEEMRAVCAELTGTDADLDGKKFDIIVCSQAYHHFGNITAVTKILASLLKPEIGRLFVADLMKYDPSIFKQRNPGHSHHHGHSHSHSHSHDPPLNQQRSQDDHHPALLHQPEGTEHHHGPMQGPAVAHRGGYSEEDIQPVFESAGLVDWKFIPDAAGARLSEAKRVGLFLAIGTRPA